MGRPVAEFARVEAPSRWSSGSSRKATGSPRLITRARQPLGSRMAEWSCSPTWVTSWPSFARISCCRTSGRFWMRRLQGAADGRTTCLDSLAIGLPIGPPARFLGASPPTAGALGRGDRPRVGRRMLTKT